ncbi:MAG: hypothetical protein IKR11_06820 [Solobacterium sp.]|nr:hypothetical protein [Solobacterium sp.]
MKMDFVSILANIIYGIVLNMKIYTDIATMPDGKNRVWKLSPIERLFIADQPVWLYMEIGLMTVSVITAILLLCKVKNSPIRTVWLISTIASTVMFIIIIIVTSNIHARY